MFKLGVFDYDRTLLDLKYSSWLPITEAAGIVEENKRMRKQFYEGKITYSEWSRWTVDAYKRSGLTLQKFEGIFKDVPPVPHAPELLSWLKSIGVKTMVVSGGIRNVYDLNVSKGLVVDRPVFSARFVFGAGGKLEDAELKDYDYAEKVTAIDEVCDEFGIEPKEEAFFVGDGDNDLYAIRHVALGIGFRPKYDKDQLGVKYVAGDMQEVRKILETEISRRA